eukprot:scaffold19179_cov149-Skeletonema_menzelii.AAC.16
MEKCHWNGAVDRVQPFYNAIGCTRIIFIIRNQSFGMSMDQHELAEKESSISCSLEDEFMNIKRILEEMRHEPIQHAFENRLLSLYSHWYLPPAFLWTRENNSHEEGGRMKRLSVKYMTT